MDEDTRVACFCCAAGADSRQLGYPARIALLVADVLAEFAAENTGLIVHDERRRAIVQSVLERFAEPQLETYTAWSPLLRHTLGATIDGLLANRDTLASAKPWLDGILDALAMARDQADGRREFRHRTRARQRLSRSARQRSARRRRTPRRGQRVAVQADCRRRAARCRAAGSKRERKLQRFLPGQLGRSAARRADLDRALWTEAAPGRKADRARSDARAGR